MKTPTPGALRAAIRIQDLIFATNAKHSINAVAPGTDDIVPIIEEETAAPFCLHTHMKAQGITYETFVRVYLDDNLIGVIESEPSGYRYWPKPNKGSNTQHSGDVYPTLEACKASLEAP